MRPFIWLYRRIGQIVCFASGALAMVCAAAAAADGSAGALPWAIMGAALVFSGVGLRAIRVWQTLEDPMG